MIAQQQIPKQDCFFHVWSDCICVEHRQNAAGRICHSGPLGGALQSFQIRCMRHQVMTECKQLFLNLHYAEDFADIAYLLDAAMLHECSCRFDRAA